MFNRVTVVVQLHTCLQSNFSVECVTAKRHYRYYGITTSYLPSPRYYREIFPIPAVITVVTAVLPLSLLLCHPLFNAHIPGASGLTGCSFQLVSFTSFLVIKVNTVNVGYSLIVIIFHFLSRLFFFVTKLLLRKCYKNWEILKQKVIKMWGNVQSLTFREL